MSLIDRIIAGADEITRIEVPEWGDEHGPLVIYAEPYTIRDDQAMSRYVKDEDPAGFVQVLIRKAQDKDGKKLFSIEDKPTLIRKGKAHVVKRVAMQIMASTGLDEAREK